MTEDTATVAICCMWTQFRSSWFRTRQISPLGAPLASLRLWLVYALHFSKLLFCFLFRFCLCSVGTVLRRSMSVMFCCICELPWFMIVSTSFRCSSVQSAPIPPDKVLWYLVWNLYSSLVWSTSILKLDGLHDTAGANLSDDMWYWKLAACPCVVTVSSAFSRQLFCALRVFYLISSIFFVRVIESKHPLVHWYCSVDIILIQCDGICSSE